MLHVTKRLLIFSFFIVLVAASCKDEDMFGSVSVTVYQSTPTSGLVVGLFDFTSSTNDDDALYTQPVINEKAQFDEVNPGNYRVVVLGQGASMYKGVQVKAGKAASVTLN